jgi:adenosylmethionine-8-amino-7-oxononanoate aminotransferase
MDEWIERDLKYNWHPYTQMKDHKTLPPILIERAEGVRLYDGEGRSYYDTISSWWCNIHGHGHPVIREAIKEQLHRLDHVLFAGFTHRPAILLAEALLEVTKRGLSRVFFSDNGSTAVETALKISFQYWQNIGERDRKRFISLENAYHGDTIGAMSVGGVPLFNEVFRPLLFPSFKIPSPNCSHCPMGKEREGCRIECLLPLEELLKRESHRVAGIILEPLLIAAGGMIIYPGEYLEGVGRLCREYGIHLILDEVATGFGRTGKMFAFQHTDVQPDILCLAKGITSGYLPLGATLVTEEIYDAFYGEGRTFYHGHTYTANPISCAAALASLKLFKEEKTLDRVANVSGILHKGLDRFRGLSVVYDIRYIGMVGAMELAKKGIAHEVYKEGLREGLLLRPLGDIIYLFLPLCIKEEEIEDILQRTYRVLQRF